MDILLWKCLYVAAVYLSVLYWKCGKSSLLYKLYFNESNYFVYYWYCGVAFQATHSNDLCPNRFDFIPQWPFLGDLESIENCT